MSLSRSLSLLLLRQNNNNRNSRQLTRITKRLISRPLSNLRMTTTTRITDNIFNRPRNSLIRNLTERRLARRLRANLTNNLMIMRLNTCSQRIRRYKVRLKRLSKCLRHNIDNIHMMRRNIRTRIFRYINSITHATPATKSRIDRSLRNRQVHIIARRFLRSNRLINGQTKQINRYTLRLGTIVRRLNSHRRFITSPPHILANITRFQNRQVAQLTIYGA